jgi:trimeric autotransporter adhesin
MSMINKTQLRRPGGLFRSQVDTVQLTRISRKLATAICFVVSGLSIHARAGQTYNPTSSDGFANTAGGTGAQPASTSTSVNGNTGFGYSVLGKNQGDSNTAVGASALANNNGGGGNTATGTSALGTNTSGTANSATGWMALWGNTSGAYNVAIGAMALSSNNTGSDNTAVGTDALFENSTGPGNTAVGLSALQDNTTGAYNTANGYSALLSNSIGFLNLANGFQALFYNTTGDANTADGSLALESNTTGSNNVALGYAALQGSSTGSGNLALGFEAGQNLGTGSKDIYVGSPGGSSSESGVIRIGSVSVQTSAFVAGISGVTVSGVPVLVSSNGQLGVQTSSARFKQDIEPMGGRTEPLMRLKPVTFHYKQEPDGDLQYGLIAEEVAQVFPELVVKDADGQVQTIRYQELTPMLLNEVQKQAQALQQKDAQIQALRQQEDAQQQQMDALTTRLNAIAGSITVASANR